jgi:hypothetical protein
MELQLRGAQKINIPSCFLPNKTFEGPTKLERGVKYRTLEITIIVSAKLGGVKWCCNF